MFRPPMMPIAAPLPPAMPFPPHYSPSMHPHPMYYPSPHFPMHPHLHPHPHHLHLHHPEHPGAFHPPIAKPSHHRSVRPDLPSSAQIDVGDSPRPEGKKQVATTNKRTTEKPSPQQAPVTPFRADEEQRRVRFDGPRPRPQPRPRSSHAPAAPRDLSSDTHPASVRQPPSINIDSVPVKTSQPRQRVPSSGNSQFQQPSQGAKSKEADNMPAPAHSVPLRTVMHRPKNQAVEDIYNDFMTEATCVVCMDLMVAPHQICPCGHVLCGPCGISWFEGRAAEGHDLTCPSCRKAVSKENMFVPVKVLENLIAKWVEGRQKNGGWEGYQDWKERNEAWTLHKQFNPESISSNMFEARPQAILQRFPVGEGMPMETLLNLIGEHAVVQRPMRHGHPNTHTMTQQTPMGLMEVTVSDGSHRAGPGGPSSFMSMFDDFDRMFHQMDGLGGGGDRRRRHR